MHVDRRLFGWGIFFILLGGIPLAVEAGVLDDQVVGQWPLLWPVLLIGWGLGLLLRSTRLALVGGAVSAITFGIMGGGLLATGLGNVQLASGCTNSSPATPFAERSGQLAATASADIDFSCGTLTVTSGDGSGWSVSGTDRTGTGPTIDTSAGGVSLRSAPTRNVFGSSGHAAWNVVLPKAPALDLGITMNAGDGTVSLPGATIAGASITLNAGALTVDLTGAAAVGDINATVNAGSGALTIPAGARMLNVSLNAGALKVCAPSDASIRVHWSGALGSNNFDAAGLVKLDNNTWTTGGLVGSQDQTELDVTANAASFELHLGGSCHA